MEADHDPILLLDTQAQQSVSHAVGRLGKLSVGKGLTLIINGDFIRSTFCQVPIKKEDSEIELLGHVRRQRHASPTF